MKAMIMTRVADLTQESNPLELVELPDPQPADNEILIRVAVCGVCHTELDEIEGRAPPPQLPCILGHEVIGRVVEVGPRAARYRPGDRVGVGWIHSSDGSRTENLSDQFRATGRDAPGGYAEYMAVRPEYAYPIPDEFSDVQAAPLLCAGAIGYRALKLTQLRDGQRLGLTGFGGSAHLLLPLVQHLYPRSEVYVFARDESSQRFARELGAVWSGPTQSQSPYPLDAIIDTTPAWRPVVEALNNLKPGGRLVINAIRKEDWDQDALLDLSYHRHLWLEREIKSVANITRYDIDEYLPLAAQVTLRPTVTTFALEEANRALIELKRQSVRGAKVLLIGK